MATKKQRSRRKKTSLEDIGAPLDERDSLQRWLTHVKENPLLYGALVVFVVLCGVAGATCRMGATASDRDFMTRYAAAFDMEDTKARLSALESLAQETNRWTAEVVYLTGETAVRAQAYDKAEAAFKRVRQEFPDSEYVPPAVDGLAFLAENRGEYEQALALYQEVASTWVNSFTARCAPMKIGRVQEKLGDLGAAVAAYQSQVDMFPDSQVATQAQEALDRLKKDHPELFPAETAEETEAPGAAPQATVIPAKAGTAEEGEAAVAASPETAGETAAASVETVEPASAESAAEPAADTAADTAAIAEEPQAPAPESATPADSPAEAVQPQEAAPSGDAAGTEAAPQPEEGQASAGSPPSTT